MIEEIRSDIIRIILPFPRNPLRTINSYVIKGKDRSLIIDTGINRIECSEVMFASLKELDIDLNKTDVFATHAHADHIGLASELVSDTSTCYIGREELDAGMKFDWAFMNDYYRSNGFPQGEVEETIKNHPGYCDGPKKPLKIKCVDDGDVLEIGKYALRCVHAPGHSPGHTCLYVAKEKLFFSGDHILLDVTPNITYWREMGDALKEYLASLDKVDKLDVDLLLPAHRSTGRNFHERIKELKAHHQIRLDETLHSLQNGEKTAYDVAPQLTWKIACNSWTDFPLNQKWFAVGETLAHLHYLEHAGKVRHRTVDEIVLYALA